MSYEIPGQSGQRKTVPCPICEAAANILKHHGSGIPEIVDCSRCGGFSITRVAATDFLPLKKPQERALASYLIRKLQGPSRPNLQSSFFESLSQRSLPTPAEATENLLLQIAERADGSPGKDVVVAYTDPNILGSIGVIAPDDVSWSVRALKFQGLLDGNYIPGGHRGHLSMAGWLRVEELKRAHVSSKFAFFARKFDNSDLDKVFSECLYPAVAQTGYELRTVSQRAGLVDAIIEDEIRRCRFLIADLSDDNAGAYWEAGLAEGLGKPVIYVCRSKDGTAEKKTHFDANHRHTVRWDLSALDETAKKLKAVIRNTLLGDAIQDD